MNLLLETLTTLPKFFVYVSVALGLLGVFVLTYTKWTPYHEMALIRAGNTAAAISFGGSVLGFVSALAIVIAHSVHLIELLTWGMIAGIIQLIVYGVVRRLIRDLAQGIQEGKLAHGTFLGLLSLAIGVLTGACMVP